MITIIQIRIKFKHKEVGDNYWNTTPALLVINNNLKNNMCYDQSVSI